MDATARREDELFETARGLKDAAARAAFLERECGGDRALRARLEGLLAVESEADQFFADSSTSLNLLRRTLQPTRDPAAAGEANGASLPGEEAIGSRIGRYKIVQKIGEGGCGVVYMAEQEEPVRRRVALKIIKLGMETKSVIDRFEAERQALAMMDHPNIARVFDAGATERGSPYFVMELVRGVKITEYCDQSRLDVRQRLDLFIQICHAIQHAHHKGIVHRDVKSSNILVTMHDGVPVPKVIDFGIAKATEARLTDKLLITAYAQLIGTPAYMSPEQAAMGGVDIDTRSDIYSLGVLLYELLTGRTPFDAKDLLESGLDEMRRILREKEPPRPSAKLHALPAGDLQKVATQRRVEPARLVALLRGDLDWIVMKALEKDRARRYETANGLATDIQRHLNNEPVAARPPSPVYRLRKLVRRNRVVFIAGAAVALALVAGTSTSTWLLLREREARQRAVDAEQQQARLRHEAETREKLTQVALWVSQSRFEEADQLLDEVALNRPTVEGAAVLRALGEWHALHERWERSAERFARLLEVNHLDGIDVMTLDLLELGPALIEAADLANYERFRRDAISRFSPGACPFPDRITKISLLVPGDGVLLESLRPLAEATAASLPALEAEGDIFKAAWRCVSVALWEYRRGDYARAEEWCRRCLAYPETNPPRTATARAIRSLCQLQLGRTDDARAELAAARELVETKLKNLEGRGTPVQGFWFDLVFARILVRECERALETTIAEQG